MGSESDTDQNSDTDSVKEVKECAEKISNASIQSSSRTVSRPAGAVVMCFLLVSSLSVSGIVAVGAGQSAVFEDDINQEVTLTPSPESYSSGYTKADRVGENSMYVSGSEFVTTGTANPPLQTGTPTATNDSDSSDGDITDDEAGDSEPPTEQGVTATVDDGVLQLTNHEQTSLEVDIEFDPRSGGETQSMTSRLEGGERENRTTLVPGEYTVRVESTDGESFPVNGESAFEFTVEERGPDDAIEIQPGESVNRSVAGEGVADDWYAVDLEAGEAVKIVHNGPTPTAMTLYAPNETPIIQGRTDEEFLAHGTRITENGTYYLRFQGLRPFSSHDYQATVYTSGDDRHEPNDERETATVIEAGETTNGTLVARNDDLFAVEASAGQRINATATLADGAVTVGNDIEVQLLSPNGTSIGEYTPADCPAEDDVRTSRTITSVVCGNIPTATQTAVAPTTGTYYVQVSGFEYGENATWNYSVQGFRNYSLGVTVTGEEADATPPTEDGPADDEGTTATPEDPDREDATTEPDSDDPDAGDSEDTPVEDQPSETQTLEVVPASDEAVYRVEVTGTIDETTVGDRAPNPDDEIGEDYVEGRVQDGFQGDAYEFTGDYTITLIEGDARFLVDGEEVSVDSAADSHTLEVIPTDGEARYRVEVTGSIDGTTVGDRAPNPDDSIQESVVEGRVQDGFQGDAYEFTGDYTITLIEGEARFLVDGAEVQPSSS